MEIEYGATTVVVRFHERQIFNDEKMEATAQKLLRVADELGQRELRLDFKAVHYIQSSVLGKLVTLHKKVNGAGCRLVLCNLHDDALKVFAVTKLDQLFVIEPAESDDDADA